MATQRVHTPEGRYIGANVYAEARAIVHDGLVTGESSVRIVERLATAGLLVTALPTYSHKGDQVMATKNNDARIADALEAINEKLGGDANYLETVAKHVDQVRRP